MSYITAADDLADKTLIFWRISRAWNGRSDEEIPMIVALETLNGVAPNPQRPIFKQAFQLRKELIMDEGRKPSENPAPPTPLRKPA